VVGREHGLVRAGEPRRALSRFSRMDGFQIGGLPLHPLLVHGVVVLLPLTSLALILGAVWPAARRRLGIVTPLAALVVLVLVPITVQAGEALEAAVGGGDAVEKHAALGMTLLPWAIGLFVVALAQWLWFRFARPRLVSGGTDARVPTGVRIAGVVLAVVAIAVSIGAVATVILIGDSGARAVWGSLG
jgi:hypothetical protein